ncbi:nucleoside recognition domain-containing protein [Anoxybacillus sp. ST4]|uniref:nucleoside recognition domain-containing protein n=1 Tax=Anoxybacillus sp. ST4 TaxID=2864181 RepID=UPI001C63D42A|nr:50S ribosome-binding GTPase [Anoxybacillus sp. ST4]
MLVKSARRKRLLLIGLESVGKTTLFSRWTSFGVGEEINVRGSTYLLRTHPLVHDSGWEIVDTPGVRLGDELGAHMLKKEIEKANHVMLVIRGTHFQAELKQLLQLVEVERSNVSIAVTFVDKMSGIAKQRLKEIQEKEGLPLILTNGRKENTHTFPSLFYTQRLTLKQIKDLLSLSLPSHEPISLLFERPFVGPVLSCMTLLSTFMLPIYFAYLVGGWGEKWVDKSLLFVKEWLQYAPQWLETLLIGDYGLLSLGMYSFVWAFPVVIFLTFVTAIIDDTGIKDRIVDSLHTYLRKIGLHGEDLIPVFTGFGCNVVAVQQSRLCHACTRKSCISLISFASACSYQLGATISVFHVAQKPYLFFPYIVVLFVVGAIHTRIWNGVVTTPHHYVRRTFLQWPTWTSVLYQVKRNVVQFVTQAMPVFLFICLVATIINMFGWMNVLGQLFTSFAHIFHLPKEVAPTIFFSIIRKDAILLLNEGNGALLSTLTTTQLFLSVYMASTLTVCAVTFWTIAKELELKAAIRLTTRQFITAISSSFLISLLLYIDVY